MFYASHRPTPLQHGRRLFKSVNTRRWGSLGVILESWQPCGLLVRWSFHLKVHHVGSGELMFTASVVHLLETYKVKIQSCGAVNVCVHVCVLKSQQWGQLYSFLSYSRAKELIPERHRLITKQTFGFGWTISTWTRPGTQYKGKAPSLVSTEGGTDQAQGVGNLEGTYFQWNILGTPSQSYGAF